MPIKTIIFDFDGTIADTYQAIINITNNLAPDFGYAPVSEAELLELQKLSSREVIKKSKIPFWKIPFLLRRVQTELSQVIATLKLIDEVSPVLQELNKRGYHLAIVTSNSDENVRCFLENNQLLNIFSLIYSGIPIFGKHRIIKKLLAKNQWDSEEVIYVGDETRDIEAARKCQIRIVSVTWGFSSQSLLQAHHPDFLIEKPSELLDLLETENQAELLII